MSTSILAIDVGNSRFKIGLLDGVPRHGDLPTCFEAIALPLADVVPWDEIVAWRSAVPDSDVRGVVAGANPAGIRKVLATWPSDVWGVPTVIDDPAGFPLQVDVESPGTVGIDRLLNAVAANVLRRPDQPVVVVDSGTATTVDVISSDGRFVGGAILPGFELSARALHQYTALLPTIAVHDLEPETPAIGRNTVAALRSGLFHGQVGAVRELVREMSASSPGDTDVWLTGGGGHLLASRIDGARHVPHLTLQGLAIVAKDANER